MYRQRAEDPDNTVDSTNNNTNNTSNDDSNGQPATEADPATPSAAASVPAENSHSEEGLSVAEVLRLRNLRKHKHGGVGFRAGAPLRGGDDRAPPSEESSAEQSMVLHGGSADALQGAEPAVIGGISKRFAPQTGLVGELVNRHM
jgi:hypothetical protein